MQVIDNPARIDIKEICYPGPYDGETVITQDYDGDPKVIRLKDAVDTSYGILHLAQEPPLADRWENFRGFCTVTGLTFWAWLLWQALSYSWSLL
jgi:hypothetical protein